MKQPVLVGAITLCLAVQCALSQYQTAPAYGNGYQQQRKAAPSPQNYGNSNQQRREQQSSNGGYGTDRSMMASMMDRTESMGGSYDQSPMTMSMDVNGQAGSGYGAQSSNPSSEAKSPAAGGSYGSTSGSSSQSMAYGGQSSGNQMSGYGNKQSAAKYEEPQHPPMPFAWGYDINDGYGASQYHKENGDEYGKRTGSYGYMDAYGVYRHVNYVADENGFRATIKTNEPGTANENPADVMITMEEPPASVSEGNKMNNGNGGYGNSAGDSGSSSYASGSSSADSENGNKYGGSASQGSDKYGMSSIGASADKYSMTGSNRGANKYAAADMSTNRGKQYSQGVGMSMMMGSGSTAGSQDESLGYGGGSAMMGSGQYAAGQDAGSSNGKYGSPAMMSGSMMTGAGKKLGAMGPSRSMSSASGAGQYGPKSAGQSSLMAGGNYGSQTASMMGAGAYGNPALSAMSMATAPKARRYNSAGASSNKRQNGMGAGKYGNAGSSSMTMSNSQYGSGSGSMMAAAPQQYGESGASSMMADSQYGSPASSMMSTNQQQQYGGARSGNNGMMDGPETFASTYASTRLQRGKNSGTKGVDSDASLAAYGGQR